MHAPLAIYGGPKVRKRLFPDYRTIGAEEQDAVRCVLDRGILSGFLGSWDERFFGGPEVRALELEWATYFRVKHAIAVNSATSGLIAAVGAAGISPGDEVIVSPYTMSASATAPLFYGGIPVFADIELEYFCLDPASVCARITDRTKAIIVVDLFGQPYDTDAINAIARERGITVIEDAAQAPGAMFRGQYAGTLGDIGVFSLNCHKHIQSGEGGVVVTNDDALANRVRLIRNHAEAVVGDKGETDLVNMVGLNVRMTEVEATISRCQLRKLDGFVRERLENCAYLADQLRGIPAVVPTRARPHVTHVYYEQPFFFRSDVAGCSRDAFLDAVRAELAPTAGHEDLGVRIWAGYAKPLYLQPMFQQRIAFGRHGYPFTLAQPHALATYKRGSCPVAERMYTSELFISELMHPGLSREDLDDVIHAFEKVWEHRAELAVLTMAHAPSRA